MTNDEIHVEELVELAARNDPISIEVLYRRYRPFVIALASSRIPPDVRGRFDVEDIVQTTFANVFRGLDAYRFEGEGPLRAWIARIAIRRILDSVRTHRTRSRSSIAEAAEFDFERALDPGPQGDSPSAILSLLERRRELQSALDALPEPQRTIVTLRGVDSQEWSAIAAAVGMSEDKARRRFNDAMKQLSRRLA